MAHLVVHHVLLARIEVPFAARFRVCLDEGRWKPLLQAAFGLGTVEAEEKHVFVCHFWREVLRILQFWRERREVVTNPTGT